MVGQSELITETNVLNFVVEVNCAVRSSEIFGILYENVRFKELSSHALTCGGLIDQI